MYYLYNEKVGDKLYLHKTGDKKVADQNDVIAFAETLEDIRQLRKEILRSNMDIYVNAGSVVEHKKKPKVEHKIMCVETGQVWENMTKCAYDVGVTRQYISYAVKFEKPIKGMHYIRMQE